MPSQSRKIVLSPMAAVFTEELGRLLQPNQFFRHPRDVVKDLRLTITEKRAILSSWAANSCALKWMPALWSDSGRVVRFDDVIDALRDLDRQSGSGRRRCVRRRDGDPEDGSTEGGDGC